MRLINVLERFLESIFPWTVLFFFFFFLCKISELKNSSPALPALLILVPVVSLVVTRFGRREKHSCRTDGREESIKPLGMQIRRLQGGRTAERITRYHINPHHRRTATGRVVSSIRRVAISRYLQGSASDCRQSRRGGEALRVVAPRSKV